MRQYVALFLLLLVACTAAPATDVPAEPSGIVAPPTDVAFPPPEADAAQIPPQADVPQPPPTAEPSGISSSQLAAHDTADDCWVAYQGKVYDITEFLPQHPNMKPAQYCGSSTAFENAFEGQHGTAKVPVLEEKGVYKGELL